MACTADYIRDRVELCDPIVRPSLAIPHFGGLHFAIFRRVCYFGVPSPVFQDVTGAGNSLSRADYLLCVDGRLVVY